MTDVPVQSNVAVSNQLLSALIQVVTWTAFGFFFGLGYILIQKLVSKI